MAPCWVILDTAPLVCSADELQEEDLSVEMAVPPRVTLLTVPPRVSPGPDDAVRSRSSFVLAADPSGLLLLQSPPRRYSSPVPRLRTGAGTGITVDVPSRPPPAYYICDAGKATAFRLPDPEQPGIICAGNVGLVAAPGSDGGRYVVAELQYVIGDKYATLLSFSSETGDWVKKRIANYPLGRWIWRSDWVISHDGKLWWVDLAGALLAFDPFAQEPTLTLIPLPEPLRVLPGSACAHCAGRESSARRLLQVSDGKFRFVQMSCTHGGAPTTVTTWELADAYAQKWRREYHASLVDLWADGSYKATGLPASRPVLALVHPRNPRVIYFFLEGRLFAVDLHQNKVVDCASYAPPGGTFNTGFVMIWELPQALQAVMQQRTPGDTEEEAKEGEQGKLDLAIMIRSWLGVQGEFEDQQPSRDEEDHRTWDPMLFESRAQAPRKIAPGSREEGTPLKTYGRRGRQPTTRSKQAEEAEPALLTACGSGEPADDNLAPATAASLPALSHEPACDPAGAHQAVVTEPVPTEPSPMTTAPGRSTSRRAKKTAPEPTLEEAKAATMAFLASVSQALQAPLANLPASGVSAAGPTTPAPRRSGRLASQTLNSNVRPSKRGEALVLKRMGESPEDEPTGGHKLEAVFHGPLDATRFAAIRDIFPAARALSDADLMAAAMQANAAIGVC